MRMITKFNTLEQNQPLMYRIFSLLLLLMTLAACNNVEVEEHHTTSSKQPVEVALIYPDEATALVLGLCRGGDIDTLTFALGLFVNWSRLYPDDVVQGGLVPCVAEYLDIDHPEVHELCLGILANLADHALPALLATHTLARLATSPTGLELLAYWAPHPAVQSELAKILHADWSPVPL